MVVSGVVSCQSLLLGELLAGNRLCLCWEFLRRADDIEKDVENNASMARQLRLAIAQKTALQIAKVKASPWTRKMKKNKEKAKEAEKKRKRQAGMASPCEPPPPPPPPPVEQDIDRLCECMIVRCLLAHHW